MFCDVLMLCAYRVPSRVQIVTSDRKTTMARFPDTSSLAELLLILNNINTNIYIYIYI